MKKTFKTLFITSLFGLLTAGTIFGQQSRDLQNYRYNDKRGVNVFEAPKTTDVPFEGLKVRMGASNTIQFQALDHENAGVPLDKIGPNFNLATSNLDLDVALYDGVRMHLRTYLSSRHHPEPYVKDGYMQIDKLDFIQEGFMAELMEKVTIKVGHMEINYGDNHFRRTDNAQAVYNPFVGNYIMDSFSTEVAGEVYFRHEGFLGMVGLSNGKLNQNVKLAAAGPNTRASVYGKLGYDSQINEDLRFRLTGSLYHTGQSEMVYLYSGDRAGGRYYGIMNAAGAADDFRSGRFNPGFNNEITAIMINPFVKFQGLEFYGVFESSTGKAQAETDTRNFIQLGGELLYRFGANEDIYLGGRYNTVSGELAGGTDVSIDRLNVGGGWFMTKNILAKAEYVIQNYNDFPAGPLQKGKFNGFMVEAVISF